MDHLVERVIKGDQEAVLAFYNLYSSRILRFLLRRLPRREDAEEILNDVFFDVIDSLPLFKKQCSLSTWLYTIAHHKLADFYRKKRIKSVLFSQVPFLEIIDREIDQPEFQFEKDKLRDNIEAALHRLSKQYQEILTLRYEMKVPVKQIALRLKLSFKATESLLFRARKSFQQAYERTGISS